MRGDSSELNLSVEENVETSSGERRPSVVALESMLKRVSQSPFNNRHTPDGVDGKPARKNPFYDYYLQSNSTSRLSDDTGPAAPRTEDPTVTNPFESQNSPLGRGNVFSEPQDGQTSTGAQTSNGHFPQTAVDAPGLFGTGPVQRESCKGFDVDDLFKPAKREETFAAADTKELDLFGRPASLPVDPFKPLEKDDDPFRSPNPAAGNLFYTAPSKSEELFLSAQSNRDAETRMDLFGLVSKRRTEDLSASSTDSVNPFQSPIAKNLFQEDCCDATPLKQGGSFHQDTWSLTQEVSEVKSAGGDGEVFLSAPSVNSPAGMKPDSLSSADLLKRTPSRGAPPPVPPKPSLKLPAIICTSPGETEQEILPPTPFTRSRNLAMSSVRSSAHVRNLKRPPQPLPRTKPPKPERPPPPAVPVEPEPSAPKTLPKPVFKPLPKPVLRLKPKTPEDKNVDPADFVVLEDILFIGPEQCVEDWPENSPQVDPNFKPSGTLRLRRESLKMKVDAEGSTGEEQDANGGWAKKKERKFSMPLLNRRRSKVIQDSFSDPRVSSGDVDNDDEAEMDYKKKPLKTKVNQLLRRASTNSAILNGKQANGLSPQEWRDGGIEKKKVQKKDSVRRWSEGTVLDGSTGEDDECGDVQQGEKKQKKLKIKFMPRRGYAISADKMSSEEPKGACGYAPRKGSKADMLDETVCHKTKGACSAEELDDDEFYRTDDSKQDGLFDGELTGRDVCGSKETFDSEQDEVEICKPKKQLKLKRFKKSKSKNDSIDFEAENPPGATSSDFLSEAARAEWSAAQKDARELEDEDEEDEGDTDSLMEWWNTVEQWDEVPSDEEENFIKEDESKSFSVLADKVERGLRVFNKVFMERAEALWQSIITIFAIADDISDFHQKAKIAGITGGTTTAVGGVTAIAGLALAPFTLGVSLVITAVGVGVATAGGITSASAAISDNVNNMNDRKKVEAVLQDYEGHLLDIGKILHFVNQGVYKLRGHPFLRSGTQHYSEDWETRRAVQMISQVDSPVMRATEITDNALASLQGLFKGMDQYFIKDSRELKKGCRKEVVAQIRELGGVLNDAIVDLNGIREDLQEATGTM